jgi:hypothetical protein
VHRLHGCVASCLQIFTLLLLSVCTTWIPKFCFAHGVAGIDACSRAFSATEGIYVYVYTALKLCEYLVCVRVCVCVCAISVYVCTCVCMPACMCVWVCVRARLCVLCNPSLVSYVYVSPSTMLFYFYTDFGKPARIGTRGS